MRDREDREDHGARGARPQPPQVARRLLAWYDRQRRDLPWRREPSAYRTLVSEFMLQQTVVAAAVPFFERFVARLPDLAALANASEDQVLALWSGLGYYARARNLHRAARAIVERHAGELPSTEPALRDLPGIGPYTAAAVAAIAFGRRTFALDGNAARVVARLAGVRAPVDQPATRDRLREIGRAWVPERRPGDFAQAVMELGATVCAPRAPACARCPLVAICDAHRHEDTARIPAKAARPPKRAVKMASVRVRDDGRLLLVRRRTGLLAGTWMLPAFVVGGGGGESATEGAAARAATRDIGIVPGRLTRVGQVRHLFTHRDVTTTVFDASPVKVNARVAHTPGDIDVLWATDRELANLAVSSFLRKQINLERDKRAEPP